MLHEVHLPTPTKVVCYEVGIIFGLNVHRLQHITMYNAYQFHIFFTLMSEKMSLSSCLVNKACMSRMIQNHSALAIQFYGAETSYDIAKLRSCFVR